MPMKTSGLLLFLGLATSLCDQHGQCRCLPKHIPTQGQQQEAILFCCLPNGLHGKEEEADENGCIAVTLGIVQHHCVEASDVRAASTLKAFSFAATVPFAR